MKTCKCKNRNKILSYVGENDKGYVTIFCNECNLPREVDGQAVLKKARDTYGSKNQIMVCIEELNELSCALAKYPRYEKHEDAIEKTYQRVLDEWCDVFIIMEHIKAIYQLKEDDMSDVVDNKIRRLDNWLQTSSSLQTTTEQR